MNQGNGTDRTVWQLARLAECADPDSQESEGAAFLRRVEASVSDVLQYAEGDEIDDYSQGIHEQADGCVPVYTAHRWTVFADLAAWQEDIEELGQPGDMTTAAGYALYMIAERLLSALVEEALEDRAEATDDDDAEVTA